MKKTQNKMSTDNQSDDVITINVMPAESDGDLSFDLSGSWCYNDTVTIDPVITDHIEFGDMDFDASITIGNQRLTEEKIEKLEAVLNILEDDPEFAEKLKAQIAFNKLSK